MTWFNNAPAPFDGKEADPATAGAGDLDGLLAYPEVMRIRVVDGRRDAIQPPTVLATDFQQISREELAGCTVRCIALVEQVAEREGEPSMLTMRELAEDPTADELVITVVEGDRRSRWRTMASRFEDAVTFLPVLGRPEIWRLINLTGDTHPIHVHLTPFQVLGRHGALVEVPEGGLTTTGTSAAVHIGDAPDDGIPHAIDDNERGLKDTVRVNANEVVDIAVRSEVFAGRYMHHCHILEHEDRDMMRSIVLMPGELMPFMWFARTRVACDANLRRRPHGGRPQPPPSRHAQEDLQPSVERQHRVAPGAVPSRGRWNGH